MALPQVSSCACSAASSSLCSSSGAERRLSEDLASPGSSSQTARPRWCSAVLRCRQTGDCISRRSSCSAGLRRQAREAGLRKRLSLGQGISPAVLRTGVETAATSVKSKKPEVVPPPDEADPSSATAGPNPGAPESSGSSGDGDVGGSEGGLSISDSAALGQGSAVLGVAVVGLIATIAGLGYVYKDEVNSAVDFFSGYIQEAGPLGYVAFTLGYAVLEVLAIPAIPLTMSAGLLFGPTVGTVICSAAATMAATGSFLIARYLARDRILDLVKGNKKYLAIDKAVGEDSFRVVALLRLSPLLPFSLGNYVYGLTSVRLVPYIFASWLGMLPGTWAYVSAGAFGRTLLDAEDTGAALSDSSLWTLAAGLAVTVAAAAYVTNLAKKAIKDID